MTHTTMEDVARRAGVSRSLVSLVMRESPHVSAERRDRVLAAAAELGYSPNAMAQEPGQPPDGDGRRAPQRPPQPVLRRDVRRPRPRRRADRLPPPARRRQRPPPDRARRRCGGSSSTAPTGSSCSAPACPPAPSRPSPQTVPMVVVGRSVRADGVDSVMTNEEIGARARRRPPRRARPRTHHPHRRRTRRRGRAAAAGLPHGDGARRPRTAAPRSCPATSPSTPGRRPRPLSSAGAGCRRRCSRRTISSPSGRSTRWSAAAARCPPTCPIVGYDNTFFARLRHVSLTTVDQPREEMGRLALDLLVDRIRDRRRTRQLVLTTPTLVTRATTAPAVDVSDRASPRSARR